MRPLFHHNLRLPVSPARPPELSNLPGQPGVKKNGDIVVTCCDPIPVFLDHFRVRLYKFILSVDYEYVSIIWQ